MFKKEKGFTLIELMIVVAIIGILAAVAIPRFGTMIKRAKEGATKGNLGALRSALSMYYGEQEGYYPAHAASAALTPLVNKDFIEAVPAIKGVGTHSDVTSPGVTATQTSAGAVTIGTHAEGDAATWGYSVTSDRTKASVYVYCNATDVKGDIIHGW